MQRNMSTIKNHAVETGALLLGIDLGTTNIKAVLVTIDGRLVALHREQVDYDTDQSGRCELPALRFVEALRDAVLSVCREAGCAPRDISAVSYASQANTFLLVDAAGEAATPIISWQDTRNNSAAPKASPVWQREDFLETTGLGIWSDRLAIVKFLSIVSNAPEMQSHRFMSISDYFVYLLTGAHIGDASTASMLGIYDQQSGRWWSEALGQLGIDHDQLPAPVRPGRVAGRIVPTDPGGASGAFGLSAGVPVIAGGLDHYIAAIGSGADSVADASESTGTVVACIFTGPGIKPLPGACFGPAVEGDYLLTFDNLGGTVLEGYRASRCPELSFRRLDELAEEVGPGADGVRASIATDGTLSFTPTADSTEPDLHRIGCEARAVLEATAFRLDELVRRAVGSGLSRIVSTGGGAKSAIWTRIKAGVLGCTFVTVEAEEPAAYGAAFLAGRGAGLIDTPDVGLPESWIRVRATIDPDPAEQACYLTMHSEPGRA